MSLEKRMIAFEQLGKYLQQLIASDMQALSKDFIAELTDDVDHFLDIQKQLLDYYEFSIHHNPWFTQEFVRFAIKDWSEALQKDKLEKWIAPYKLKNEPRIKTIGVVMAGNLPLVGFHDYLSILIGGYQILAKLSSDDAVMLPILHKMLSVFEPEMVDKAIFTQGQLKDFDAIIATGSDNTARYFEYYFGKYPNIIRKNRSGIAILNGKESDEELKSLSVDITAYFGLGCRSVSKLYVPKNYEFKRIFEILEENDHLSLHHKLFNNYEYNKAIYLVNSEKHFDIGFLLFKEDTAMSSPISVIYYEEYSDLKVLKEHLALRNSEIQCVIGEGDIPFGQSQHPKLNDYADGVDTIAFLKSL